MSSKPASCNLTVIRSTDLERAAIFYERLGLTLTKHRHGQGPMHLAHETESHTFEIYPLTDTHSPTSSTRIGFAVESVDTVFEDLIDLGAVGTSPPNDSDWGRRAVVTDFDGHRVELTSR